MTKKDLQEKIKLLGLKDKEQIKKVACSLIGHSNIISTCFGYVHCGRCGDQIGDTLAGCYPVDKCVIIDHNCSLCRKNYKKLNWKDKFMTPNPFKDTKNEKAD